MNTALKKSRILLPASGVNYEKWAVIACDQYTGQREYWQSVENTVGDAPSALRLILPEIDLDQAAERLPAIHETMNRYLDGGILTEAVDGFVLTERITSSGVRPGLVAALDLEEYDPAQGSASLIRATEGTVASRVPPRARIRAGARLELPHVMMLIDDPGCTVIEPLYERQKKLRTLYDFDLMLGGGHLRGWAVENADADEALSAMERLSESCGGLLYAVGDGNHSLAAAKQCWQQLRAQLSESQRENHPARYALVELINLNCPALTFEPIHRIVYNVNSVQLMAELRAHLRMRGFPDAPGRDLIAFDRDASISFHIDGYPLPTVQGFLDQYILSHSQVRLDYIHGEEALRRLVASTPQAMGFRLRAFEKRELFPAIRRGGTLPRKAFSMGEADDKRYYLEARRIL